jgi:hypothetical protein
MSDINIIFGFDIMINMNKSNIKEILRLLILIRIIKRYLKNRIEIEYIFRFISISKMIINNISKERKKSLSLFEIRLKKSKRFSQQIPSKSLIIGNGITQSKSK